MLVQTPAGQELASPQDVALPTVKPWSKLEAEATMLLLGMRMG